MFFQDPTVTGTMQTHIAQLMALEESEAARVLSEYRRIRQSLRDRLDTLPEGKFQAHQLQMVLVQVESALLAMDRSLKSNMTEAGENVSAAGVQDLVTEIEKFTGHFEGAVQPININQVLIASDAKNLLANKYEASLTAYSADIRQSLVGHITQASIEEVPLATLVRRLSKFMVGEEWKLLRIARTELHNVYNLAKLKGMGDIKESYIPDLKKSLFHPMDNRTSEDSKDLATLHPIVAIDKPFRFTHKGDTRVFMVPPDRPNDRSILVPIRSKWSR